MDLLPLIRHSPWATVITRLVTAALILSLLHDAAALFKSCFIPAKSNDGDRERGLPSAPGIISLLRHLPLRELWNPVQFILSAKNLFRSPHPVRLSVLGQPFYVVQGTQNIQTILKHRSLSTFPVHGTLLKNMFCLPRAATALYHDDDSGEHPVPHPASRVEPRHRVEFLNRSCFSRFLSGPGLAPLLGRFQGHITGRIAHLDVGDSWVQWDDLMNLFHTEVTSAALDAMCGPYLVQHHPTFVRDLWCFDHSGMRLACRLPRFLASGAYAARDRALAAVKDWHAWATDSFDPESVGPDGDDPYWGASFFRCRQDIFNAMEGFDADAIASEELAFLWGASTNAVVSGFWTCLEVLRDPQLLSRVRGEAQSCLLQGTGHRVRFDTKKLLRQPWLQAALSEALRLRIHGFLIRYLSRDHLEINGWTIPRKSFVLSSSTPGHMDPDVWSTGEAEDHPPGEFWPARFIEYSDESRSFEFTMKRSKGAWMPFGGRSHSCPGRHFTKLQVILTVALLVTMYDCEVLADEKSMEMGVRNFGFGALGPKGRVPVRIRRRQRI